jgi:serine/threonine protein kinase
MPLEELGQPFAEGGTSSIYERTINTQLATVKVLKGRFCEEVANNLRKDHNYLFDFIGEYDSNLKIQHKFMDSRTNLQTLLGVTPERPLINPIPTVFGYFLVTDEDRLGGNCRMPTMAMQKLSDTWLSFCTNEYESRTSEYSIRNQCRLLNRNRIPDGETLKNHFIDFLRAVYITHAAGISHLDISPKNVMFDSNDRSYLIDLG